MKPVAATVFSPRAGPTLQSGGLAIDGDPQTVWPTDTYTDAVPFPGFKNGVGLMLQLPEPTKVGSVTVALSEHRNPGSDPLGDLGEPGLPR